MEKKQYILEYYDRKRDCHHIGTFHMLGDEPINKGDEYIIPPRDVMYPNWPAGGNGIAGVCEGRENHPAYMKPLLLICKDATEDRVRDEVGHGAWLRECVMVQNK